MRVLMNIQSMDERNQGIFSHCSGIFFNIRKILLPANCALDTSPDIKHASRNSSQHFTSKLNNLIKIAAENSQSVLSLVLKTISHMSTCANITKSFEQFLKTQQSNLTQLHNKLAFDIFHLVPNFANILTTMKIGKISFRQRRSFYFVSKSKF